MRRFVPLRASVLKLEMAHGLRLRERMMSDLAAALSVIVRSVVREELRAAFAAHRQQEDEREGAKLLPLPEAARKLNLTPKALRSRIERGSVPGAQRVGSRWHVPLRIALDGNDKQG